MDGIEQIAARIREDAQQEIARMNQEADQQIEAIQAQAQAQADRDREEILARGRRAAEERLERLKSAAQMQRRTLELDARQQVLGEAFAKALEQLCHLPNEELVRVLGALALQAAPNGGGQLIFAPQDRERIGAAVVAFANEALSRKGAGGTLTLSEQTRPIQGGFILADGPVEVNCSFEAMLRLQREKLEKPVAQILTGDGQK